MKTQWLRAPVGAFAFAALALVSVAGAQETYSTWSKHRDVFLNTTSTTGGASVAGTVTNFPVLVRFVAKDSVFAQALARGADLRFTKVGDVVRLKHQIESWDTATKTAAVWVLVDTVYGNNKTQKIRLHWGKSDAADSSRGAQVFTTANGFFNVWHLGDTSGVAPRPTAVTGGDVATPMNFDPAYAPVAGLIGKAESLLGGGTPDVTNHFALGSGTGYSSWATGFTFSVWVKPLDVQNQAPFFSSSNGYATTASDVIIMGRQAQTDLIKFRVRTGNGAYSGPNTVGDIVAGEWQHFAFTRGGNTGTARIYKNGVEIVADESMAAMAVTARPNNYLGGSFSPADNNYSGLMDEARLSKAGRSADWVKLEYENQKPTGGLVFFDSAAPASVASGRFAARQGFSVKASSQGVVFQIGEYAGSARLTLVDMWGRTVWKSAFTAGSHRLTWNGRTVGGSVAAPGLYLARVEMLDKQGRTVSTQELKVPLTR